MMKRAIFSKRFLGVMLVFVLLAGLLPAQAAGYQTIRPGDQGENVRQMQRALRFLGFELADDGKYGRQTAEAVSLFQARMRLFQDGLAGDRTLTALYDLAPQFKPGQQGGGSPPEGRDAPLPQDSPADYGQATVITPDQKSLNLRRSAARGQNTFYQIPHGTVLRVLGISGQWVRVETEGRVGYVQQDFLRPGHVTPAPALTPPPTALPSPTAAPLPGPAQGQAQVVTRNQGSLNLRRTAARGQNVFYQIPYGTVLQVLGVTGPWTQVEAHGRVGFVQSDFLKPVGSVPSVSPSAAPGATPAPAPGPGEGGQGRATVYTRNGGSLNLRSQARHANNILAAIPFGDAVAVLERGGAWSRVSYQGQAGYVMSSFLRFDQEAPQPTPVPEESGQPDGSPSEAPTEAPGKLFPRILRAGDAGDDVRRMQEMLRALKYDCEASGSFDESTLTALRRFQSLNGLTVDGVFGSQSSGILTSGSARDGSSAPISYPTLSLDSVDGDDKLVSALQKALSGLGYPLTVNGRYDVATHQAVVAFQQINKLPPTGTANALTQSTLFSGKARRYDPSAVSGDSGGTGGGPSSGQVKLLHWYNDVKKSASAGQQATVYHPGSGISFRLRFYSMGAHADSEPLTLQDTQRMNKAFGPPSWNINVVYVKLPDGRWTMASMHNRPHLSGNIRDNGFDGHLCVHFLRDLDETTRNDPNYGLSNQKAIRKAWERLTGETLSN